MASELGGNMEGLIINCLQAAEQEYDPDFHTDEKMANDVKALYEMGQGYVDDGILPFSLHNQSWSHLCS